MPYEFWERDLHSKDRNAAAAIARILKRYDDPPFRRRAREEPEHAPVAPAEPAPHPPPLLPACPAHPGVP